jgi:membrane protein YdbS with pleckstrin-like domain
MSRSHTSAIMQEDPQGILKETTPDRTLRTCYTLYLLIIVWGGILPWLIPLAFFSSPLLTLAVSIPLLLIIAIALWWIGAYFRSIRYHFTALEIVWERGVWFRQSGIVPYRLITAVTITQGPVYRFLGISRLSVQTDGNAPGTASTMDFKIDGITEPELLRDFIITRMQEERVPGG